MGVCQSGEAEAGATGAWAEDAEMQDEINNGGMRNNKTTGKQKSLTPDNWSSCLCRVQRRK